jgi:CRP/FNR family cyclic AMP-dependent transcriptional regulator
MDKQDVIGLLGKAPLFSRLSKKGLEAILKSATEKAFGAGEKILQEGESGVGFYQILEGSAQVIRGDTELARLGPGDFFGELAVLDGKPRTADVVALEDTTCLILTRWAMKSIIPAHPDVALGMLEELARRLRESNRALS